MNVNLILGELQMEEIIQIQVRVKKKVINCFFK